MSMNCRLDNPKDALVFCADDADLRFEAILDAEDKLGPIDLLSQVDRGGNVSHIIPHIHMCR